MKVGVKRISALILTSVIVAGIFGACTQKDREGLWHKGEPASEKAEESVTLNFTTWVNNKDAKGNYVDENVIKEFTKQNPNIKVKFHLLSEGSSGEYLQKIDMMLANGEDLDVISIPNFYDYIDKVRKGMLFSLDNYITAEGKKYFEMFTVDTAVNGKIYALPWDIKPMIFLLNKKYLDEAGLPIPKLDWTWEDYREYAKKLTKGEGKNIRYGGYFSPIKFGLVPVVNAYGYDPLLTKDGGSNITDPNIRWSLKFINDVENVDKSHLPYFEARSKDVNYREAFLRGKVAMLYTGSWMIPEISGTIEKYPHEWVTAFAAVPRFKGFPANNTFASMAWCSVPKTSKHPAEAYKLVKFYSEEGVNIRATGLPAKKEYNLDQLLSAMMNGKENLYDIASLKAVMQNAKISISINNFPYYKKVEDAVRLEFEKYMVGGITLDSAIANADKAAKEIIEANK